MKVLVRAVGRYVAQCAEWWGNAYARSGAPVMWP